jgi:cytochrome c peroxidase
MKTFAVISRVAAVFPVARGWALGVFLGWASLVHGAELEIQITPTMAGAGLQPGSFRYSTSAGEKFSVTRVGYLASEFALQRADGSWLTFSNQMAWFDLGQSRDTFRLRAVPAGDYQTLRFTVGLRPDLNHLNITNFPAGHPLNPDLNDLYWGWQGGFIFLALEGLWRNGAGEMDGWAYHLARDTNATSVQLAAPLTITNETRLRLDFDLAVVLNAPRPIAFGRDGSTTHSRAGDPLAAALVENLRGAFRVRQIQTLTDGEAAAANPAPLYLPAKFTPYPLPISGSFPIPDLPRDNPLTVERVALGRALFFDRRLSGNGAQACADCHVPAKAFTDGRTLARGAFGDVGMRNSMSLVNLAWKRQFFWDGRANSLREQVLQPIQNPLEMHASLSNVVAKLAASQAVSGQAAGATNYPDLFAAAFGSPEITPQKIALALEDFLLTLTSFDAKFDRVMRGEAHFTPEEARGFVLFSTEYDPRRGFYGADCFHCHGGPLFQSQAFANNGLESRLTDAGKGTVTGRSADDGKFAVPSLRNVALTAPYMHDGRFATLAAVVEHYCTGVRRSATLDPNLAKHPDGGVPLAREDKAALVAFLQTLTDARWVAVP